MQVVCLESHPRKQTVNKKEREREKTQRHIRVHMEEAALGGGAQFPQELKA